MHVFADTLAQVVFIKTFSFVFKTKTFENHWACILQMAALGIHGNEESGTVSQEDIDATLDMLENPLQRVSIAMLILDENL